MKDLLRYQTGRAANIVLIDRGRKLERISTDRLRKMEEGWAEAEPLAKDFTLFGLKSLAPETFVGGKSIVKNQARFSVQTSPLTVKTFGTRGKCHTVSKSHSNHT